MVDVSAEVTPDGKCFPANGIFHLYRENCPWTTVEIAFSGSRLHELDCSLLSVHPLPLPPPTEEMHGSSGHPGLPPCVLTVEWSITKSLLDLSILGYQPHESCQKKKDIPHGVETHTQLAKLINQIDHHFCNTNEHVPPTPNNIHYIEIDQASNS